MDGQLALRIFSRRGALPAHRRAAVGGLCVAFFCCASLPLSGQMCFEPVLFATSEDGAWFRRINLTDLTVLETSRVEIPGEDAIGVTGVAVHPVSREVYLLVETAQFPGAPHLVVYDTIENEVVSLIGNTGLDFGDLIFDQSGVLYAVTSETANPPNALCELSLINGLPIDICSLGAGDEGEALGYNPLDGRIYHASGSQNVIFEVITDPTPDDCITQGISIAQSFLTGAPVTAIAWDEGRELFLWKQGLDVGRIFGVTATGDGTLLAGFEFSVSDLAVGEGFVPCANPVFIRGDADGNASVQGIVDGVHLLNFQFVPGSPAPPCLDAADADDSGGVSGLVDGVFVLNYQFAPGSPPPPPPGPTHCGIDPTDDAISCNFTPVCP